MTKLKILIVEDKQENVDAARKFFDTKPEIEADYAQTYQGAINLLEQNLYAGAIVDINFPREPGKSEEIIGLELGEQLNIAKGRYRTPHVYLSAGFDNHRNQPLAFIYYDKWCYENKSAIQTKSKACPEAWAEAFERLQGSVGLDAIMAAKLRYQKVTGKTTFEVRK